MTYQEEDDQQLVNEALLFGGICALLAIGVAALGYYLIKHL